MIIKYKGLDWDFVGLEEEKKEQIGEILSSPQISEVVFSEKQKEFMDIVLTKIKEGENHNLLFSGFAGTGKTYSSKMIACETGKPFVYLTGSMGAKKIVHMLLNLKKDAIVLIDEIHNIPEKVAEIIYPAIEYGEIYLEGERKLVDCMFIGTTTEPESLPKPLMDRFMRIEFDEPNEEMVVEILKKMEIKDELIGMIINFTMNIRVIKKIIKYLELYGKKNKENLGKVFKMMGINVYTGLSDDQEKYVRYLKEHIKASLRALSLVLRRGEGYIRNEIETELVRKDMIVITSRGRELSPTMKAENYHNLEELEKVSDKGTKKFEQSSREIAITYLNDNPVIKKKFGKRYFELISFIAEHLEEGICPDEIDFESFGTDVSVEESFKNNYLEEL